MKKPPSKVIHFEGLRGFAALMVFFNHFILAFYPALYTHNPLQAHNRIETTIADTPFRLFYSGGLAVSLFFCLSGFVLSLKFFKTHDTISVVSSAARRYIRLVIPILAASIVVYVLLMFQVFYNHEAASITRSSWLVKFFPIKPDFAVMLKESLFNVFYRNAYSYNPVLWTMQVELYGSFIVYGILLVFGKFRLRFIIYAIAVGLSFKTYYLGFILGMMLCDISASGLLKAVRGKGKAALTSVLLISGLGLGFYANQGTESKLPLSMITFKVPGLKFEILYTTIGAFLILAALVNSRYMQRLFSTSFMAFLGKISFSMYLLHLSVIFTFSSFLFRLAVELMPYNASVFVTFLPTLGIVFTSSWIMYRYVDITSIRAGKMFWDRVYGMTVKVFPRIATGTHEPVDKSVSAS